MSAQPASDQGSRFGLAPLQEDDLPRRHPVRVFAEVYWRHSAGMLLPDELDILQDEDAEASLTWGRLVEPVEVDGGVDFYVIDQGANVDRRSERYMTQAWMSETVDPQFVESRYRSLIAASILRRPVYSRGSVPDARRSFLSLLRGVFPVFADNQARLRLLIISAEPYVET